MKLNNIFNINPANSSKTPEAGSLLISEPFLAEPYVNHAVIMLVNGSRDDESMGVVLNNQSDHTLGSLIGGVEIDVPVFCGGPLGLDRLYTLHTLGDLIPESQPIAGTDLYIGGRFSDLLNYVNSGYPVEGHVRFFVGYSGWSARQLGDELDKHVWTVSDVDNVGTAGELLTGADNSYWHRVISRLGDNYRPWRLFPKDARHN